MDPLSEQQLVRRFLAGEGRAFEALYDLHAAAMYQMALRLLGGRQRDAEDTVQEAWLRAAAGLGGFEWRSRLRTWLIGITVNCARELMRSRLRSGADRLDEKIGATSVPPEVADPDLERAILALSPEARFVLLLHDLEGYSHAEIAARLGIEEGTSRSRLSRGRALVRAALSAGLKGRQEA